MDILMSTPKYICSIRTKKNKEASLSLPYLALAALRYSTESPCHLPPLTLSVAGHRSLLGKQGVSSYKVVVRKFRTTSGGKTIKSGAVPHSLFVLIPFDMPVFLHQCYPSTNLTLTMCLSHLPIRHDVQCDEACDAH